MRSPKVLYLLPYFELGGTERHLLELARMAIGDFSILVVSPGGDGVSLLEEYGIPHIKVPTLTLFNILKYRSIIKKLILEFRPYIIHIHGAHELVFIVKNLFPDIPVIFTSHGYASNFPLLDYTLSADICDRYSDKVIAVSEYERRLLLKRGLKDSKVCTIYNGISPVEGNLNLPLPRDVSFKIVTVARLTRKKGIKYLIEAFGLISKKYKDTGLFIIGEGEERKYLEKLVGRLNLRNVFFLGKIPDAGKYLNNFDIFVLPSLSESLGISIIEAYAEKRAVIATKIGGIPELIVDGETGLLVAPGDSYALADSIEKLILDRALRDRLAYSGYNRFLGYFTSEKMYEKTLNVYKSFL